MIARREARRCRAYNRHGTTASSAAALLATYVSIAVLPLRLPNANVASSEIHSLPAHQRQQVPEAFRPAPFVPCLGQANDDDDERRVIKRPRLSALKMTPEELKLDQARLVELRKQKEAQAVPANEEERLQMEAARRKREEDTGGKIRHGKKEPSLGRSING